ncbi:hypothetical protein Bp8pS_043 [Bacillus phage vB_BpuM-BpSp]|nr:hypothetical protein Bp8pS_043 [Bacillus phage vB_BpuM-BpSp]
MKDNKYYGFAIADIHFGKKDDISLFNQLNDVFIKKINQEKSDIDFVIIAGDLFDRVLKLNEVGSNLAIKFVDTLVDLSNEYNFAIRILKGTRTHDFNQLGNFKHIEAKEYPRFQIIESVEEEEIFPDIYFLYLPEEYMDNPEDFYKSYFNLEEDVKYDMIFFHGTFDFVGYIPHIESERHVKEAPVFNSDQISSIVHGKAIGGHIHTRHTYKDKIEYTSSFSRFSFGEEKPKGFVEITYDPQELKCNTRFIENTLAPDYITINMEEMAGISLEDKIKRVNALKKEYKNIRIKAKNINNEDVTLMKGLVNGDDNIKLDIKKDDIEDKIDEAYLFIINKEYSLPKTVQKYIELETGKNLSIDEINKSLTK